MPAEDVTCSLIALSLLPEDIELKDYSSRDESYKFLHNCALIQNKNQTHKVYLVVFKEKREILGFISIHVNSFKAKIREEKDNTHFPILDIAFISISKVYDFSKENCKKILTILLEKVDTIAIEIAKKAGCCFIRSYIPFRGDRNIEKAINGDSTIPYIKEIYKDLEYVDLSSSENYKLQKKTRVMNSYSLVKKFVFRDLRIQTD